MEERQLGRTGLAVSALGLGCNNFGWRVDEAGADRVVGKACDIGVTLFDTADGYGAGNSEILLGHALGARRKDVIVATKFGMPMAKGALNRGGSRRYIMKAAEDSLKRLGTDWIDLYQIHMPDPSTPIEETLRAFDDLVHQGKVRYIGCSNHPAWRVAEAHGTARHLNLNGFVSAQDEYSLVVRDAEKDLIPALEHLGMGLLPYFPLASGLLTGKYKKNTKAESGRLATEEYFTNRHMTDANWAKVERLNAYCAKTERSLLDIAFAWLLAKPSVASVIAGATSAEQVERNAKAVELKLEPQDVAKIDELTAE
jgi:aryl-alcohol dehydrogenase-like predicted oxidoreductase